MSYFVIDCHCFSYNLWCSISPWQQRPKNKQKNHRWASTLVVLSLWGERMSVRCEIKNYQALKKQLDKMQKAPKKVIESTLKEIKSKNRGQSWIAQGVAQRYNIKAKEITGQKIGKVSFKGDTIKSLQIEYDGRMLTPIHFGMTPKKPGKGTYTLKYKVMNSGKEFNQTVKKLSKKQRAALAKNFTRSGTRNSPQSPWMLQYTGGGEKYIPFQRRKQPGKMEYVQRAISLPQMITEGKNGPMHPEVAQSFNENLEKRFNHYVSKYLEK